MTRSAIGDIVNPPKPPVKEKKEEPKISSLTERKRLEFTNIKNIHQELANHMIFILRELNTDEIQKVITNDVKKEKIPNTELEEILGKCLSKLVLLEEKNNLYQSFSMYVFEFLKKYSDIDKTPTKQGRKSPLYEKVEEIIEETLSTTGRLPTNSELERTVKKNLNPAEPDSVSYALRTASKHLKKFKEKGI